MWSVCIVKNEKNGVVLVISWTVTAWEVPVIYCHEGQEVWSAMPLSQNKSLKMSAIVSASHGMSGPRHAGIK